MKTGDLVKMKYDAWWKIRSQTNDHTGKIGVVYSKHKNAIKVLLSSGDLLTSITDQWEVVVSLEIL